MFENVAKINTHNITVIKMLKIFRGNYDRNTVVTSDLKYPPTALCVRIHPVNFHNKCACLRFEVIGAKGKYNISLSGLLSCCTPKRVSSSVHMVSIMEYVSDFSYP